MPHRSHWLLILEHPGIGRWSRRVGNGYSATDQRLRDRLASERDRQNHRHAQLSQLLNRLQQWLGELRGSVALAPAPPVSVELQSGRPTASRSTPARREPACGAAGPCARAGADEGGAWLAILLGFGAEKHDDPVDALVYLLLGVIGDGIEEQKAHYV
jgi:hypothetical protein